MWNNYILHNDCHYADLTSPSGEQKDNEQGAFHSFIHFIASIKKKSISKSQRRRRRRRTKIHSKYYYYSNWICVEFSEPVQGAVCVILLQSQWIACWRVRAPVCDYSLSTKTLFSKAKTLEHIIFDFMARWNGLKQKQRRNSFRATHFGHILNRPPITPWFA